VTICHNLKLTSALIASRDSVFLIGPKVAFDSGNCLILRKTTYATLPPLSPSYVCVGGMDVVIPPNTAQRDIIINVSKTDMIEMVTRLTFVNVTAASPGTGMPGMCSIRLLCRHLNHNPFLKPQFHSWDLELAIH
jgi:hypothetical protein